MLPSSPSPRKGPSYQRVGSLVHSRSCPRRNVAQAPSVVMVSRSLQGRLPPSSAADGTVRPGSSACAVPGRAAAAAPERAVPSTALRATCEWCSGCEVMRPPELTDHQYIGCIAEPSSTRAPVNDPSGMTHPMYRHGVGRQPRSHGASIPPRFRDPRTIDTSTDAASSSHEERVTKSWRAASSGKAVRASS